MTATLQTMEQTASYALTVSPAPLQVIANPQQRAFGPATPPLTYTYSGFVNGDTASVVSGTPTLTTTATTSPAVGAYPITVAPRNERGQIHADRSRWHTDDHASANDNYTGRLTDLGGVGEFSDTDCNAFCRSHRYSLFLRGQHIAGQNRVDRSPTFWLVACEDRCSMLGGSCDRLTGQLMPTGPMRSLRLKIDPLYVPAISHAAIS